MLRCLTSLVGVIAELCLVRAVGTEPPDGTVELASDFCARNGIEFRGAEYENVRPFPHVDNFAAARNLSFSLATSDWCLWLDCDDYLDEINQARLREVVTVCGDANGIFCNYRIADQGAVIMRERLIRRGCGTWVSAIHETCEVTGTTVNCPQIVVYHADPKHKVRKSSARNLAILQSITNPSPRELFYLHSELMQLGRHAEAQDAGNRALHALPASMVEERYFVRLCLSQLEPTVSEIHLLDAARIQPHRREAFADLSQKALAEGRLSDAISWFRIMDALPLPEPLPWTHRGMWHGWARDYLRVKILRAIGKTEMAAAEHAKHLQDTTYREEVAQYETAAA